MTRLITRPIVRNIVRSGIGRGRSSSAFNPFTSPDLVYGTSSLSYADATYLGMPYLNSGKSFDRVGPLFPAAQAMLFDGVNDYATRGVSGGYFGGLSQVSIVAWVKFTGNSTYVIAGAARSDNNQRSWLLHHNSSAVGKLSFLVQSNVNGSSDHIWSGNTNINDNAWHHVAVTWNAGSVLMWVDGVSQAVTLTVNVGTPRTTIATTTEPFTVGATNATGTPIFFFPGCIYDLRPYSGILTQEQVLQIYNQHLTPTVIDHDGILAHYANGYFDISSNARHLTAVGGATTIADTGVRWDWREHGGYRDSGNVPARYNGGSIPVIAADGNALTVAGRTSVHGGMESPVITGDGVNDRIDAHAALIPPTGDFNLQFTAELVASTTSQVLLSQSTDVFGDNGRTLITWNNGGVSGTLRLAVGGEGANITGLASGTYLITASRVGTLFTITANALTSSFTRTETSNILNAVTTFLARRTAASFDLYSSARIGDFRITTSTSTITAPFQDGSGLKTWAYDSSGNAYEWTIVGGQSSNWNNRSRHVRSYDILNGGRMSSGRFIVGLPNSSLCVDGSPKTIAIGKHGNDYARRVPNIFAQSSMQAAGVLSTEVLTPSQSISTIVATANTGFSRVGADGTDRDLVYRSAREEPELSQINAYIA